MFSSRSSSQTRKTRAVTSTSKNLCNCLGLYPFIRLLYWLYRQGTACISFAFFLSIFRNSPLHSINLLLSSDEEETFSSRSDKTSKTRAAVSTSRCSNNRVQFLLLSYCWLLILKIKFLLIWHSLPEIM
uniref:Uncharacterized protein n=1 Tax=Daphnia galeata TaxID=27404 RepID=A0A8J2RND3_9CRUS|nr:unnamed protein product [Daphnia galeata]